MRLRTLAAGSLMLALATGAHAYCPTDIDQNGQTNVNDLVIVLAQWGQSGQGDVDGDGLVEVDDMTMLIDAWGACPDASATTSTSDGPSRASG